MNTYQQYRSLTKEQLHNLGQLRPYIAIRDAIINWTIILLMWGLVYIFDSFILALVVMPVIGCQLYALMIIAHDGLHRIIFKSRSLNDLFCNILLLGPILAVTRINRLNHISHHKNLSTKQDPDTYKYRTDNKDSLFKLFMFFCGISTFFRTLKNVFSNKDADTTKTDLSYKYSDIIVLLLWQIFLIGGLTYFISWWAYPILFAIPFYIFAYLADTIRVFCEHSYTNAESSNLLKNRLITYESCWLEKLFFSPHNMNYHAAHHLWPFIPYYNLPRTNFLLKNSKLASENLVWRTYYTRYLYDYIKWIINKNNKDK